MYQERDDAGHWAKGALLVDTQPYGRSRLGAWVGEVIMGFEGPRYDPGWLYRLRAFSGHQWTVQEGACREATYEESVAFKTERADHEERMAALYERAVPNSH